MKIVYINSLLVVLFILSYIVPVFPAMSSQSRRMLSMVRSRPRRMPTSLPQKSAQLLAEQRDRVKRCIEFIDSSPEPYHCVSFIAGKLKQQGFQELVESTPWQKTKSISRGGKYFFTRNDATIVAFTVGDRFKPGNGFKVIGAHTDSPNLKIKPCSKKSTEKLIQLNVECYGGGLWHTWFDRDLSLAGRVIVRSHDENSNSDSYQCKLLKIDRPILRIPNLCIHLRTPDERENFKVNKEDHLVPILCDAVERSLSQHAQPSSTRPQSTEETGTKQLNTVVNEEQRQQELEEVVEEEDLWTKAQEPNLISLLAQELKCNVDDIADFELALFDVQGAAVSGLHGEYLCGSRIDNLASCFVAVEALEEHAARGLAEDEDVSIVALFDHEEVGSDSNTGAGSTIMRDAVERISNALMEGPADMELFKAGLARSMILSVDMAHAVHPNYAAKHDKAHAPTMNKGIVIKSNANQRYATTGVTGFFVRELGRRIGVPVQEFAVRNDCPCGSTIGPIISHNTGIRAVDLGMPQLSMHSIREMMGGADLTHAHHLFVAFLKDFRALDASLTLNPRGAVTQEISKAEQ